MNKNLSDAIYKLSNELSVKKLTNARDALTNKYRDDERHGKAQAFMDSDEARISYLNTRFPATYAAIESILKKIKEAIPDLAIETLTDLGSGPGTAFFAAISQFSIQKAILIEQDKELISLGKLLEASMEQKKATWQQGNLQELPTFPAADLITISYALNELDHLSRRSFIEKAWKSTNKVLLIVEPGSRQGFSLIKEARAQLITYGAHMIAPCPHVKSCPMEEPDWCHFSQRVNRSTLHRQLKNGTLGYEDEKFSYIAVSKESINLPEARIIRHPEKHSGHFSLTLCTKDDGLIKKTFSKKDGPLYKSTRKLEWGDALESL